MKNEFSWKRVRKLFRILSKIRKHHGYQFTFKYFNEYGIRYCCWKKL